MTSYRDLVLILSSYLRVAAGQNTTFILARPNEKFSELPRHPFDVNPPEICVVCDRDNGEDDSPLECDKVGSITATLPHVPLTSQSLRSATIPTT